MWWGQGSLYHYVVRAIVYSDIFVSHSHILPYSHIINRRRKLVIQEQPPAQTDAQDIAFKVFSNKTVVCSLSTAAPPTASSNTPPSIINPANQQGCIIHQEAVITSINDTALPGCGSPMRQSHSPLSHYQVYIFDQQIMLPSYACSAS